MPGMHNVSQAKTPRRHPSQRASSRKEAGQAPTRAINLAKRIKKPQ